MPEREIPSQDQQQAQSRQQLFVRPLPEEEVQNRQEQQVPGVQISQAKLVQQMPQGAGEAVARLRRVLPGRWRLTGLRGILRPGPIRRGGAGPARGEGLILRMRV